MTGLDMTDHHEPPPESKHMQMTFGVLSEIS
jgi:hypothetical protein